MPTKVHFIDVGQGNMTLLQLSNGKIFLYDCNVTNENGDAVLEYLAEEIGWATNIDVFVSSHRDADHMRGVKRVHTYFPIQRVWDTGVTGTTPDCAEYREYMDLRRQVGFTEVKAKTRYDYGDTRLRIMNAKNDDLANNANGQSIVIKVVHRNSASDLDLSSVLLTGDTDAVTWKNIQKNYTESDLSCSILLASHHGSITYFDDLSDEKYYYTGHIRAKAPDMTIISVGDNPHGHPDDQALKFYMEHTKGSRQGNKVYRTDEKGHIWVTLKDNGGWELKNKK